MYNCHLVSLLFIAMIDPYSPFKVIILSMFTLYGLRSFTFIVCKLLYLQLNTAH